LRTDPTERQIGALCEQLRRLGRYRKGVIPVDDIERRLKAAVTRERAGTTVPDSYPSATLGGEGSGGRRRGSPTEKAAAKRADGEVERDRHRELTTEAVERLTRAVEAIQALSHRLDALDDLQSTQGPLRRHCEVCTGLRPLTGDRDVYRRSTVGDRLKVATDLCEPCYDFVRTQFPKPGQRDGRVPTFEEVRFHDQRGRWKLYEVA
jgi:hypothetical protein